MTWRLFICCECDSDEGVVIHPVPEGAHGERGCNFDFCPACGGHHSMISMGDVEVSGNSLIRPRLGLSWFRRSGVLTWEARLDFPAIGDPRGYGDVPGDALIALAEALDAAAIEKLRKALAAYREQR